MKKNPTQNPMQLPNHPTQSLRKLALAYPEVQEGTVCNKSAFKARNKGFLFIGADDESYNVMVKLRESLAEAAKLEAQQPDCYRVGAHGWVQADFRKDQTPPPGLFEKWIDESYRLLVHKQLVAMLPEHRPPAARSKQSAKSKPRNKKITSR